MFNRFTGYSSRNVFDHIKWTCNSTHIFLFSNDMDKLQQNVRNKCPDKAQNTHLPQKNWLGKLKDTAYELEDIMDEYAY